MEQKHPIIKSFGIMGYCAILNTIPASLRLGLRMAKLNEKKVEWIIREMEKGDSVSGIAKTQKVSRR